MRRGSIVIGGERGPFSGKPRPWLVVQRSRFLDMGGSISLCPVSTTTAEAAFRVSVRPNEANGLNEPSIILVDKITTLKATAVQRVVGEIDDGTMTRVDEALRLWLDL